MKYQAFSALAFAALVAIASPAQADSNAQVIQFSGKIPNGLAVYAEGAYHATRDTLACKKYNLMDGWTLKTEVRRVFPDSAQSTYRLEIPAQTEPTGFCRWVLTDIFLYVAPAGAEVEGFKLAAAVIKPNRFNSPNFEPLSRLSQLECSVENDSVSLRCVSRPGDGVFELESGEFRLDVSVSE